LALKELLRGHDLEKGGKERKLSSVITVGTHRKKKRRKSAKFLNAVELGVEKGSHQKREKEEKSDPLTAKRKGGLLSY